jgi:hypothetical protein
MDKVNLDSHRTFFPFILVGLSVLLAVGLYAFYSSRPVDSTGSALAVGTSTPAVKAPTHDEYVSLVSRIVSDFQTNQSSEQSAYDRLVAVTVPPADLATHLELVIIFGKFRSGETVAAQARYQTLKQTVTWLP